MQQINEIPYTIPQVPPVDADTAWYVLQDDDGVIYDVAEFAINEVPRAVIVLYNGVKARWKGNE